MRQFASRFAIELFVVALTMIFALIPVALVAHDWNNVVSSLGWEARGGNHGLWWEHIEGGFLFFNVLSLALLCCATFALGVIAKKGQFYFFAVC